jgi:glycosyltransferase involved in cell wall biosynthesis
MEASMRVLLVHNFYQIPGGEDAVVREELDLLRENGVEVELFSANNDQIVGVGRRVLTLCRMVYSLPARKALAMKLKEFPADVVHIHNFFPLLSPSILDACRDAGVPTVMTLHNFRLLTADSLLAKSGGRREPSLRHGAWWTVRARVYRDSAAATLAVTAMIELHKHARIWQRKIDRFIVLTNWCKRLFVAAGLPPERIVVKPNCVRGAAGFSGRRPDPDGCRRNAALFVGRLDDQKGVRILLQAWQKIEYPLRIVGDGPLRRFVEQNASERIEYIGRQPRGVVLQEMRSTRFLVLPSIGHELFPMTILEAFSSGLPVICSDDPALGELIEDGITGLTFPQGDDQVLADRVRWAIANPAALEAIGRRARAVYEQRYTPEANFRQLLDIYRQVCRRPLAAAAAVPSAAQVLH